MRGGLSGAVKGVVDVISVGGRGADPLDDVYTVLANRRRRFVIHRLFQVDEACRLRELSRTIAAWEYDKDPEHVTAAERHRVYNSLQQVHLPKLDDYGLVEFDDASGTVHRTDKLDEFTLYLEVVPAAEIPWSTYYLLLATFSILLDAVTWAGVGPFDALPFAGVAFVTAALFVVSAGIHAYVMHQNRMGFDGPPPELGY